MTEQMRNAVRSRTGVIAVLVVAWAALTSAAMVVGSPVHAQQGAITGELLTGRHTFTDDVRMQIRDKPPGRATEVVSLRDASHMAVMRLEIAPGGMFPWHSHPGPVLVAVTEGDFVYLYADDCVRRDYAAGEGFVDPGGDNVHMAYNPSDDDETVVIATFLGVPEEGALTLPVEAAHGQMLDERCAIDRAGPSEG